MNKHSFYRFLESYCPSYLWVRQSHSDVCGIGRLVEYDSAGVGAVFKHKQAISCLLLHSQGDSRRMMYWHLTGISRFLCLFLENKTTLRLNSSFTVVSVSHDSRVRSATYCPKTTGGNFQRWELKIVKTKTKQHIIK